MGYINMKFLSIKNFIYFLILTIIIYSSLIFIGDYQKISTQLENFNWLVIPAILFFAFFDDFIRFFKWDYFLKKINVRIPKKTSFLIFFSGLAMSITPAKVGEILKSYLLKQTNGVEMRKSIMVVAVERLTDVLGLAILALIGSFAFISSFYYQIMIVGLLMIIAFFMILLTNKSFFIKMTKLLYKIPIIKNHAKFIEEIYESSRTLLTFKSVSIATTMSVFSWFFECFAFYLLLNVLGVNFSIMASSFVFAFSSVFGNVIPIPGGLGATEGSFVGLLLLNGVQLSTATLATIIIRLGTLFYGITLGIIALILINKKIGNKNENTFDKTTENDTNKF